MLSIALGLTGCRSTAPEKGTPLDNRGASVFIRNSNRIEITDAVLAVFRENGFTRRSAPPDLVFERRGSTWDNIAWGDWAKDAVWQRARVAIQPYDFNSHRVSCDVVRVLDHGDRILEQEKRVSRAEAKPVQALLEQVKARVEGGR